MTLRVALVLLTALVLGVVLPAVGASAQSDPGATTTTPPATPAGGTSPWVLVLIGAAAGALVGTFTGLARRRRAERERADPPRPAEPGR